MEEVSQYIPRSKWIIWYDDRNVGINSIHASYKDGTLSMHSEARGSLAYFRKFHSAILDGHCAVNMDQYWVYCGGVLHVIEANRWSWNYDGEFIAFQDDQLVAVFKNADWWSVRDFTVLS